MSIVLNARGTPEPPTEIVARLQRVHPNLGIRYAEGHGGRNFSLTWRWPENDPRYERVKCGEIGPESAYDIVGSLPADCPLDQAGAYAEASLRCYPVKEVSQLCERMHKYNEQTIPALQNAAVTEAAIEDFASSKRQKNPRRTKVG